MEEGHFGIAKILSLGVEGLRSINPLFPGCIEKGCVQLWFHCGFAEAQAFVSSPPFADIRWFQAGSGTSLWTRIAVTEQDFNARSPAVEHWAAYLALLRCVFLARCWAAILASFWDCLFGLVSGCPLSLHSGCPDGLLSGCLCGWLAGCQLGVVASANLGQLMQMIPRTF